MKQMHFICVSAARTKNYGPSTSRQKLTAK